MVDPNPARGMPIQLQRYWLHGKGAAKIRWGMPHDFDRCVRALRSKFPQNPEGLCNILHQKALGAPPGKGHPGEASLVASSIRMLLPQESAVHPRESLTAAAINLLAQQQFLGPLWAGPLAPIDRPTTEPRGSRVFEHGALSHRPLPLHLSFQKVSTPQGHAGSVAVGRILGVTIGPDHAGQEWLWGFGDWFDAEVIPEVTPARYLVDSGVVGVSLDPGGPIVATVNPETGTAHMSKYMFGGATIVTTSAFMEMRIFNLDEAGDWPEDDPDMVMALEEDCGCDEDVDRVGSGRAEYVSSGAMQADKGRVVSAARADEARIVGRAGAGGTRNVGEAGKGLGKVVDSGWAGKAELVSRERIAATREVESGQVDTDRNRLVNAERPEEERLVARGSQEKVGLSPSIVPTYAINANGWQGMPLAPREAVFDNDDAIRRITAWAAGNTGRADPKMLSKMFMWRDQRLPETDVTSYRLPYGDIISGKPTMVYHAIYAAAALLSGAHGGLPNIPDEEKNQLRGVISNIYPEMAKTFGDPNIRAPWDRPANVAAREDAGQPAQQFAIEETDMSSPPLYPSRSCFENPKLTEKTPLTVTSDWRVYGHLAAWGECHRDFSNQCVLAPRSKKDYEPFHLGTVFTAEGETIRVGKIVMDTRHAGINLNYRSAAIHYDDTGDEVAVVRAGEDEFGIWVAGAIVPEADQRKVQKLRRSPISGDWRAVDGNLELTAALAVNVPAFPVYSMDGEQQLALVAAGTLMPNYEEEYEEMTGEEFQETVDEYDLQADEDEAQEDRAWELRAVIEDHDVWNQWQRAKQLAEFAAETGQPVTDPGPDPIYGDLAMANRQADAQFSVMEDTGAGTEDTPTSTEAPVAPQTTAPVTEPAPVG